jgi:hypothetical protein
LQGLDTAAKQSVQSEVSEAAAAEHSSQSQARMIAILQTNLTLRPALVLSQTMHKRLLANSGRFQHPGLGALAHQLLTIVREVAPLGL